MVWWSHSSRRRRKESRSLLTTMWRDSPLMVNHSEVPCQALNTLVYVLKCHVSELEVAYQKENNRTRNHVVSCVWCSGLRWLTAREQQSFQAPVHRAREQSHLIQELLEKYQDWTTNGRGSVSRTICAQVWMFRTFNLRGSRLDSEWEATTNFRTSARICSHVSWPGWWKPQDFKATCSPASDPSRKIERQMIMETMRDSNISYFPCRKLRLLM